MLESEFSLELGELMEEHLERNNSIPMFLAGLIMQLYYKQNESEDVSEIPILHESDSNDIRDDSDSESEVIEVDDD